MDSEAMSNGAIIAGLVFAGILGVLVASVRSKASGGRDLTRTEQVGSILSNGPATVIVMGLCSILIINDNMGAGFYLGLGMLAAISVYAIICRNFLSRLPLVGKYVRAYHRPFLLKAIERHKRHLEEFDELDREERQEHGIS